MVASMLHFGSLIKLPKDARMALGATLARVVGLDLGSIIMGTAEPLHSKAISSIAGSKASNGSCAGTPAVQSALHSSDALTCFQVMAQPAHLSYLRSTSSAATAGSDATSSAGNPSDSLFVRSRYKQYWRNVVCRELMLKRGPQKEWREMPSLDSIELSIHLEDTRLDTLVQVDKQALFLHRLALEYVSGKAADYIPPPNKKALDKAAGVRVTLHSDTMYNFLEKLVYVVMPNQMGFEGFQPAVNLAEEAMAIHKRAKRATPAPRVDKDLWGIDIEVPNMLVFPEFVEDFELFEPLQSMRARLVVKNSLSADDAMMLLEAFGLPRSRSTALAQ